MSAYGDMFLKVTSAKGGVIKGEATDPRHAEEIDVLSFSWGMRGSASMSSLGAAVKTTLDTLHVTKNADRASTALLSVIRSNDPVVRAVLTVRKAGGAAPVDFFIIRIEDGRILSYDVSTDTSSSSVLVERISFSFQRIEIEYTGQSATGEGTGASMFNAEAATGGS